MDVDNNGFWIIYYFLICKAVVRIAAANETAVFK